MEHLSVMKEDVQNFLSLNKGESVIDATLGLGGHSRDMLEKIGEKGILIAFEQDERNLNEAKRRLKEFESQIVYIHDNFRYLKSRVNGKGIESVDAILFDLGLSSPHVDEPERGFSFKNEGPLDMRFDLGNELRAEIVVNEYSEEKLAEIIKEYGEERFAKKIARDICIRRKERNFKTTTELAEFIENKLPKKWSKKGTKAHPATKTFQALRIEVNDEIEALKEALEQAFELLRSGGRIVILSYHSLEDRIVKQFFKALERPAVKSNEEALYRTHGDPLVEKLTKKPLVPGQEEILINPRARSAKLRAYKKI